MNRNGGTRTCSRIPLDPQQSLFGASEAPREGFSNEALPTGMDSGGVYAITE